ncbi:DUF2058 domain-containing protein [Endozoicomonas ascidiicola]|uniref:DUF2058 domain-containing protein n=1 Tax=Endozoicomonas ascidiicola TaxID=1698521 RepID=UPI00082F4687|nr:DUF2058 domain-containing protein [Endozoicomonas ascidiicola]
MAKSLRDQLMKAGLATKQQALQAKTSNKKNKKQAKKSGEMTEQEKRRIELEQEKQAKIEKDRELNRKLEDERQRKAVEAQVKQLIEANALSRDRGESKYKFVYEGKIKKIYVTSEQQIKLERGLLALAMVGEDFLVIPAPVASKVAERKPEAIVMQNDKSTDLTEDEEDWYADYQIPDDLMW